MKNFVKILIFSLLAINTYAQQAATEIDSKSVKLPRYADQAAIELAIPIPQRQQGMMVYNIGTASNWYYNGTAWTNNNSTPYPLIVTGTTIGTTGNTSITGESIVTYPPIYSGPDVPGGTGVHGISDGGIYGIGVRGQGNGPFHVGVLGLSNYRGVQGGSTSGIGVYGNSSNGISGKFEIDNFTNSSDALHAITTGTGKAGLFEINNALNSNHALIVNKNGLGRSGWFQSTNSLNNAASLIGENYGLGQGVYGTNFGTGKAGVFEINNTSNANFALEARTNGLGRAGYFVSSNTTNNSEALFTTQFGLGKGGFFEIYNGSNNNPGLHSLTNGTGKAGVFEINNTSNNNIALHAFTNGGGDSFYSYTGGLGRAGIFQIDNASNSNNALLGASNGTGQAIYATMSGTGKAGVFQINNTSNNSIALHAFTNGGGDSFYSYTGGLGRAGIFQIDNASNSANALSSTTNGTGKAAYFQGTNALETDGTIKFGGSGVGSPTAGKVLTSTDGLGNATWQAIPAVAAPLNLTSTTTTFSSTATGASGYAGSFQNTHSSNPNPALEGVTFGPSNGVRGISYNGVAGLFSNSNYNVIGGNSALIGHSNSNDYKSIYGISEGNNGQAGVFQIQNGTNTNAALESSTNGPGKAAYFHGINALETDGTIKFGGSGVGTPAAGKVLTATDGLGNATWQAIPAVTAPLNLTSTVTTLQSIATGASGFAGDFQITNTSNAANALSSTTTGTGKAAYFQGTNALETNGTIKFGGAGVGTIAAGKVLTSDAVGNATWQVIPPVTAPLNLTSTTTTMSSSATGTSGNASNFNITNVSNASNGISVSTAGTGKAIDATNNSSTNPTITAVNNTNLGNALDITGGIKVSGTNKAAFKITSLTGTNITGNYLKIPNTTFANNENDIIIVTHNYSPNNTYLNKSFGVYWASVDGTWRIYLEDLSSMPNNITFNVLVIKQ
ncbi:MAG: hypothetical protein IPP61_18560 [Cytophagaceae bacterium]|nr:hypothetical protein [Cytophagaceae bacterium]